MFSMPETSVHHQQTNIQLCTDGCPSCHPTNSVTALKQKVRTVNVYLQWWTENPRHRQFRVRADSDSSAGIPTATSVTELWTSTTSTADRPSVKHYINKTSTVFYTERENTDEHRPKSSDPACPPPSATDCKATQSQVQIVLSKITQRRHHTSLNDEVDTMIVRNLFTTITCGVVKAFIHEKLSHSLRQKIP